MTIKNLRLLQNLLDDYRGEYWGYENAPDYETVQEDINATLLDRKRK